MRKVNNEEEPELGRHFEISSIPTLMRAREKGCFFHWPVFLPSRVSG